METGLPLKQEPRRVTKSHRDIKVFFKQVKQILKFNNFGGLGVSAYESFPRTAGNVMESFQPAGEMFC